MTPRDYYDMILRDVKMIAADFALSPGDKDLRLARPWDVAAIFGGYAKLEVLASPPRNYYGNNVQHSATGILGRQHDADNTSSADDWCSFPEMLHYLYIMGPDSSNTTKPRYIYWS